MQYSICCVLKNLNISTWITCDGMVQVFVKVCIVAASGEPSCKVAASSSLCIVTAGGEPSCNVAVLWHQQKCEYALCMHSHCDISKSATRALYAHALWRQQKCKLALCKLAHCCAQHVTMCLWYPMTFKYYDLLQNIDMLLVVLIIPLDEKSCAMRNKTILLSLDIRQELTTKDRICRCFENRTE